MNKQSIITILFTILMSMTGAKSLAYDLAAANSDGITIYYRMNPERTEMGVSCDDINYPPHGSYSGDVVIPESVDFYGNTYRVTSICFQAFKNCNDLTSVTIPQTVTSIGLEAFSGCDKLASIDIPNSVDSIGAAAFWGTDWYKNQPSGVVYAGKVAYNYKGEMPVNTHITLKDGTIGIADEAFYNRQGLTSITIPNGVTIIGHDAFFKCSNLKSINIPNSVKTIGGGAFWNCVSLTSVTIPNSVENFGGHAFRSCEGLTSVTISNGVKSIEVYTFSECRGLTSITIPNSVVSIGENAFYNCYYLTSVTLGNGLLRINKGAFPYNSLIRDVYCYVEKLSINDGLLDEGLYTDPYAFSADLNNIILHVPQASIEAYRSITPWKNFGKIVALTDDDPKPTGIKFLKGYTPNYPVGIYSFDGKRLQKEQRGLNIIKMNDGKTIKRIVK